MFKLKRKFFYKMLDYVVIFGVIYLSSSFVGIAMNGTVNLVLTLSLTMLYLLFNMKQIKIDKKILISFLFIVGFTFFSVFINNDNLYNHTIFLIPLICAFIISNIIEAEIFLTGYVNIMYFLSTISIITFILIILVPQAISYFPLLSNQSGITVYNLFFSVVYNSNYFKSNYGLFWEPGAFQVFVNLALFFQLFIIKNFSKKRVIILILTVITTFSTTGYFAMALLICIYFLSNSGINKQSIKTFVYFLFFCLISYFVIQQLPENIYFKVFGKLEALFDNDLLNYNQSFTSTNIRINSLRIPFDAFMKNPAFGLSFSGLNNIASAYGQTMITATPLNWFGLFGFFIGNVFIILNWNWVKNLKQKRYIRILLFIFLILLVSTENLNRNTFYFLFLLVGIKNKKISNNRRCKVNE